MSLTVRATAFICGLLAAAGCWAETRYRLEVLVFEYPASERSAPEIARFAEVPDYPRSGRIIFDEAPLRVVSDLPPDGSLPNISTLPLLPAQDLKLATVKERIQSRGYKALLLAGWIEEVPADINAEAGLIRLNFTDEQPAYEGSITFLQRRQLQVILELYRHHELLPDLDLPPPTTPQPVQLTILKDKRTLTDREIHYFDAPDFGVVIYSEPVGEAPAQDPAANQPASATPDLNLPPPPTVPEG